MLAAALVAAGLGATTAPAQAKKNGVEVDVKHKTLLVKGTNADDKLTLRVRSAHPDKLEIDVGDDGSADAKVKRKKFTRIRVEGGRGDDQLRIDDSEVAFTDTTPTTLDGQRDDDTLLGGRGAEKLFDGGPGNNVVVPD